MIKTRSNFKLCGEEIIPKFDHLIALYMFTVVSNQTSFNFLIAHNSEQLFSQLTTAFFTATVKPNKSLISHSLPHVAFIFGWCPHHVARNCVVWSFLLNWLAASVLHNLQETRATCADEF
jgi:hypothetical protein